MSYTKEQQIENRKKWVEALRSGTYFQCQGTLQTEEGYCCLGVVTDLYLKENNLHWYEGKYPEDDGKFAPFEDASPDLCDTAVMEYVGLRTVSGKVDILEPTGRFNDSLADMNDRGVTFEEIANVIESSPDGLFYKD